MTTLSITLVLALIVAWITAAATTVRSVSRIWLRHWVEQQQAAGSELSDVLVDRPQRWLLAAGTGIAASVFAVGAVIGLRETGAHAAAAVAAALALLMLVGQLLPRVIARRWATPLAPALLPVLRVLGYLCTPLFAFGALFARRTPSPGDAAQEDRDALEDLLREGELEGVGEASESAIISGVVEFGEKLALEVMTLREDIIAVERTMPPGDIARVVSQSEYSRIPVYDGDLDHVVGLLHSFDILAHPDAPAASLRRVALVRAATPCHELMRNMLREHVHLAIIQGASGTTLGLVTLEDLVEELVGEISDEHDEPHAVKI
jgi:putative hemolysin